MMVAQIMGDFNEKERGETVYGTGKQVLDTGEISEGASVEQGSG